MPGTRVTHPQHPEWGSGWVQSAIGNRVTVNFEQQGKVTILTDHVRLNVEQSSW